MEDSSHPLYLVITAKKSKSNVLSFRFCGSYMKVCSFNNIRQQSNTQRFLKIIIVYLTSISISKNFPKSLNILNVLRTLKNINNKTSKILVRLKFEGILKKFMNPNMNFYLIYSTNQRIDKFLLVFSR